MAAGRIPEAAFKEVRVKAREAWLAYGYDPATPEADGEDEAEEDDGEDEVEDGIAFDNELSDGEGDGGGEVVEPSGQRDNSVDDTESSFCTFNFPICTWLVGWGPLLDLCKTLSFAFFF